MPKPKNVDIDLRRKMELLQQARLIGKRNSEEKAGEDEPLKDGDTAPLQPLPRRIAAILGIVRSAPKKATTMNYLILYDIEDNRVRNNVAKYLKRKGCIRIQKSVFMANSNHRTFEEICETLQAINEVYENRDSIILVPVNVSDVRSMKLIGSNVNIDVLVDPPNTLFF